jgi:hypothetical protein
MSAGLASSLYLLNQAKAAVARRDFHGSHVLADSASVAAGVALEEGVSLDDVRRMQVRIASFIVDTWAPLALKAAERSSPAERPQHLRLIGIPLVQALGYLVEQADAGRLQYSNGVAVSRDDLERTALELTKPIVEALAREPNQL